MTNGWQIYKLNEVIERFIDYRGKTPRKTASGVPLITAKIVKGGFIGEPDEFIAEDDYDAWMRRGLPQKGDVVLTTEAPLGEVAQITDHRVALAQRIITLRGKKGVLDNTFLKFALQSPIMRQRLHARASGSTVQGIKGSELEKVEIDLPSFYIQRRIADILGALDDKIEVNRRINKTLEQMAQALYKHWFVDFAPFRDGGMVESELGQIPNGWGITTLGETADLLMGQSPASQFYNQQGEGLPFHQGVTDFGWRFPKPRIYCSQLARVAEAGSILFSVRAPVGRVNIADRRVVIGRGVAALNQKQGWNSYLYYQLRYRFAEEDSLGSGTIFNAVTKSELERVRFNHPLDEYIEQFDSKVSVFDKRIASNEKEIQILTRIRDYLLPKLMSGEVQVKDAEKQRNALV